jgi:hypothetical protein
MAAGGYVLAILTLLASRHVLAILTLLARRDVLAILTLLASGRDVLAILALLAVLAGGGALAIHYILTEDILSWWGGI